MSATTAVAAVSWERQARDPYFIVGAAIYLAFILMALLAEQFHHVRSDVACSSNNQNIHEALSLGEEWTLSTLT